MMWILMLLMPWQAHPFVPSTDPSIIRATMPLIGECMSGPDVCAMCGCAGRFDTDADGDVDLMDVAILTRELSE